MVQLLDHKLLCGVGVCVYLPCDMSGGVLMGTSIWSHAILCVCIYMREREGGRERERETPFVFTCTADVPSCYEGGWVGVVYIAVCYSALSP